MTVLIAKLADLIF